MPSNHALLVETVAAIAPFLDGWHVAADDDDHVVKLQSADNASLWLRFGTYGTERGRLIVTGHFEPASTGDRYFGPNHRITVAADRQPEKIAADIRRRLLPGYLEALTGWRERMLLIESAQSAADRLRADLAQRLSCTVNNAFSDVSFDRTAASGNHVYGHLDVPRGSVVTAKIHGLNEAQARRLADLIASL